jgi:molybdate transport system substrate-binding protein
VLAGGCGRQVPPAERPPELTVAAAASLKEALGECAAVYHRRTPQVKVNYIFGGSGTLQQQIAQGAPVDVFIAAAAKPVDELAAHNLSLAATRRDIATNQLVLIVAQDAKLALQEFADLAKPEVRRVSMGEPVTVPAGQYAQQVLQRLGLWEEIKGKTVLAKDVRTVLAYVATGNVEAGVVYRTDALVNDQVRIVAVAPAGSHQPIVYPAVVVAGSSQPEAATAFITFLAGPEGQAVLARHGFGPAAATEGR